jgi:hypothetical protein
VLSVLKRESPGVPALDRKEAVRRQQGAVRPTEADLASLPYASAAPELVAPEEDADLGVAPEEDAKR